MTDSRWVILIINDFIQDDRWYETFNKSSILWLFHTEPYFRYINNPPENPKWSLFEICENYKIAFNKIEEYSREIITSFFEHQRAKKISSDRRLRFQILKRDGYKCQLCGRTAADGVTLEVDHKIPKSRGGANIESNLWTLCFDCNRGKLVDTL